MSKEYLFLTGASSGIGKQCAIQLSQYYNLVLCARRIEKLEETKSMCQNPANHFIFQCDLSNIENLEDNLKLFLKNTNVNIGKFVHCGGISQTCLFRAISFNTISEHFKINAISAELIVKILNNKKYNGTNLNNVVFVSSINSIIPSKAFSHYVASKAALDGIMKCLALELAPRVRVNSVLPGLLNTDMTKNIYESEKQILEVTSDYPLGKGELTDIVNAIEFLLSDKSRWITGQQIVVDGGAAISWKI